LDWLSKGGAAYFGQIAQDKKKVRFSSTMIKNGLKGNKIVSLNYSFRSRSQLALEPQHCGEKCVLSSGNLAGMRSSLIYLEAPLVLRLRVSHGFAFSKGRI
jgi:hypothetical protein